MNETRLAIDTRRQDDATVLYLLGEVDPHTIDTLDRAVDEALQAAPSLVLDLSGVSFIDSAGLRSLIRAQRGVEALSGALVLRAPRPSTVRVLEITGLTGELTIEPAV